MDNNEFVMPFERAFKRLRVDGDELPTESIKNSSFKFSNDKSVIKSRLVNCIILISSFDIIF